MKFLHLADLHIGKRVKEISMLPEQRHILNRILDIVKEEGTDGVFIAGDVYDKSVPTIEAVNLFDSFLNGLCDLKQEVFIVAGNHDSAERLAFAADLLKNSGIHISHAYEGNISPIPFTKGEERADITLLPFIRPANVRACYPEESAESYSDAVRLAISKIPMSADDSIKIIITHQFVTGSLMSGSEEMTVGGINNVDYDVFSAFDYVALGHVHKRQSMLGGKIHYPGTPIKYSVEETAERTCTIVETEGKKVKLRYLPLVPLHDMREIKGAFDELLRDQSEDYVYIVLTDSEVIPDAVKELRKKYPNLMSVTYEVKNRYEEDFDRSGMGETTSPLEFIKELYSRQNGAEMDEKQTEYIIKMIEKIWQGDEDEGS